MSSYDYDCERDGSRASGRDVCCAWAIMGAVFGVLFVLSMLLGVFSGPV